ncbi:MAG TPA: penicillin-insensitive murein endopeptidase [Polyangiaceae bacterium LLY-WYZ-15_(1-7)]|nr:penicillin-insensitive murein endopeptidase [Polyangiaceae bacterium LLY-WYZ-15_(1-7)]
MRLDVPSAATLLAMSLLVSPDVHATPDDDDAPTSAHAAPSAPATPVAARVPDREEVSPTDPAPEAVDDHSRGYPWRGRLEGDGVRLEASDSVHLVEAEAERGFHWGTRALVGLVERAAARVAHEAPSAFGPVRLHVGELSKRGGGNIPGHSSHENGRDVDLGFYMLDAEKHPYEPPRFLNVRRSGRSGHERQLLRFDDERNFLLIRALIEDPETTVQHAFVHRSVRRRLMSTARRMGASPVLLEQIERVVIAPGVSHPHRNHFHVRIYCPSEDAGVRERRRRCRDRGPWWPWLPEAHPWRRYLVPLPGLNEHFDFTRPEPAEESRGRRRRARAD